jgi:hypothetical protein
MFVPNVSSLLLFVQVLYQFSTHIVRSPRMLKPSGRSIYRSVSVWWCRCGGDPIGGSERGESFLVGWDDDDDEDGDDAGGATAINRATWRRWWETEEQGRTKQNRYRLTRLVVVFVAAVFLAFVVVCCRGTERSAGVWGTVTAGVVQSMCRLTVGVEERPLRSGDRRCRLLMLAVCCSCCCCLLCLARRMALIGMGAAAIVDRRWICVVDKK